MLNFRRSSALVQTFRYDHLLSIPLRRGMYSTTSTFASVDKSTGNQQVTCDIFIDPYPFVFLLQLSYRFILLAQEVVSLPRNPIIAQLYVDREILDHLNMKNHFRKSRLSISRYAPDGSPKTFSESAIRAIIEKNIPILENRPYKLRYQLIDGERDTMKNLLKLKDVEDVSTSQLSAVLQECRAVHFHVQPSPGIFPPSSEVFYQGGSNIPEFSSS